jgi:hypothetical protein
LGGSREDELGGSGRLLSNAVAGPPTNVAAKMQEIMAACLQSIAGSNGGHAYVGTRIIDGGDSDLERKRRAHRRREETELGAPALSTRKFCNRK